MAWNNRRPTYFFSVVQNVKLWCLSWLSYFRYNDILLNLPKRSKRQVVGKLGCRVVFLKYLGMNSVSSADLSKFYLNIYIAL